MDIPSAIYRTDVKNAEYLTRELEHSTLEQAYKFFEEASKYNLKK